MRFMLLMYPGFDKPIEEADVPVEPTPDGIAPTQDSSPSDVDDVPLGTRPARGALGRDRVPDSLRAKITEVIGVYLRMAIKKRQSETDVELVRTAALRHRQVRPAPPKPLPAAGD